MLVLLREALSNQNTPFAKLVRTGKSGDPRSAFPEVNGVDRQHYRPNRKLSPAERARLAAEYLSGKSAVELAREFKLHRQTVARHVQGAGIAVRPQLKMTQRLVERAERHYAEGHSLAEVGKQLGVEASTVGKVLKRAGVKLRAPVADRWHGRTDDLR